MPMIRIESTYTPDPFSPQSASERDIAERLRRKGMGILNYSDIGRVLVDLYAKIDELTAEIEELRAEVQQK